jgi:hypothetical protein
MEGNVGAERPGHVADEHGGTPTGRSRSELGNVGLPTLDSGNGGDIEVEEALVKLFAGWLGQGQGGELGRSH